MFRNFAITLALIPTTSYPSIFFVTHVRAQEECHFSPPHLVTSKLAATILFRALSVQPYIPVVENS